MRTSGTGRDGFIAAVPIAIIIVFTLMVFGGPRPFLRSVEHTLMGGFYWVVQLTK
jgi:hypothetical protein